MGEPANEISLLAENTPLPVTQPEGAEYQVAPLAGVLRTLLQDPVADIGDPEANSTPDVSPPQPAQGETPGQRIAVGVRARRRIPAEARLQPARKAKQ